MVFDFKIQSVYRITFTTYNKKFYIFIKAKKRINSKKVAFLGALDFSTSNNEKQMTGDQPPIAQWNDMLKSRIGTSKSIKMLHRRFLEAPGRFKDRGPRWIVSFNWNKSRPSMWKLLLKWRTRPWAIHFAAAYSFVICAFNFSACVIFCKYCSEMPIKRN